MFKKWLGLDPNKAQYGLRTVHFLTLIAILFGSLVAVDYYAKPQQATAVPVQTIGPRDEIIRKAHALAKKTNGYIYGEKENGGTNTIYVSPVPFEVLNKAIEKGKGKPHLHPVKDTMAQANNLTAAMVFAPVAGITAAVGKFVKLAKNNKNLSQK